LPLIFPLFLSGAELEREWVYEGHRYHLAPFDIKLNYSAAVDYCAQTLVDGYPMVMETAAEDTKILEYVPH